MWPWSRINHWRSLAEQMTQLAEIRGNQIDRLCKQLTDEQDAHAATLDVLDQRNRELSLAKRNDTPRGRDGKFVKRVKQFNGDNAGVTIIEYGLLAALLVVGLVVILETIGGELNTVFTAVSTAL